MGEREVKVLSIQSHVVHGYVGNRSATFPLQYLGYEVDVINSVQFSNHTGYMKWKGQVLSAGDLKDLYEGLKQNDLCADYTHVLSGYVGDAGFLRTLAEIVTDLKAVNPDLQYFCDPVLGDYDQGYYVPKSLVSVYRDEILPVADVICPNQFEIEEMTGKKVTTEEETFKAIDELHAKGPKVVVVSSAEFGNENELVALVSDKRKEKPYRARLRLKKLECGFTGTGDLFASLVLANSEKTGCFGEAMKRTIESMKDVLTDTVEYAIKKRGSIAAAGRKYTELRLIQNRKSLEQPKSSLALEVIQ